MVVSAWKKGDGFIVALVAVISSLSAIASILSFFRLSVSLRIGIFILGIIVSIVVVIYINNKIKCLKKTVVALEQKSEVNCNNNPFLLKNMLEVKNYSGIAHTVFVIGSGTLAYYQLFATLLKENKIEKNASINFLFRNGDVSANRLGKLLEYDKKWRNLANRYSLNLKFFPIEDFVFSFRGVLFDSKEAYIGFYHRLNNETIGGDEEVMHVDSSSPIGKYLIDNFKKCFDGIDAHDTIESSLDKKALNNKQNKKEYNVYKS